MNASKSLVIGAAGAVLAACSLASKKAETARALEGQKSWTLVWSDEFEGDALDLSKWAPETSCWGGGNNERQCYTGRSQNINVSDGILTITARAEEFTGQKYPQDWPERGEIITQNYTSGKVRSKGLAHWQYGRFEARIKLPQGQSTWPAFWMLPENNSYGPWPLSGEIDIMEAVNLGARCEDCQGSITENRSSAALHFGKTWPENKFRARKAILPNGPDAYHIFALEWSEGQIDWFVDDVKIFSMEQHDWFTGGVSKKANKLAPFDQPFYMMLNLAVGGNASDQKNEKAFNPASFPSELLVDWVRVYQCAEDLADSQKCRSF